MESSDLNRGQKKGRLFDQAIDLEPERRSAFLEEHCADDPQLKAELEALLRSDAFAPEGFLPSAVPARSMEGTRIGSYQILGRLGEGGMGTVYVARQDFPSREVALKLMRPGRLSEAFAERFQKEVQALGSLHHPGIAQVFEAGTARLQGPGGMLREEPFLAMELVRGTPLIQYADDKDLSTRQRLELVARLADAVHHAHQRGVIHRDLKPENILVAPDETKASIDPDAWSIVGQPKILDFGIARLINDPARSATREGEIVGTLAYMSPEQLGGESARVDARSDVYALGVLLYQLLGGRLPHDLSGLTLPESLRVLRNREPLPLGKLDPQLKGDVSTIASRALEPEPERRYGSAAELAEDLRLTLRSAPIRARSDSALYVLHRRLRRHRTWIGAAGLLALMLAFFGQAIMTQAKEKEQLTERSERDLATALETIEQLTRVSMDHLDRTPDSREANREVVMAALAFHESVLEGRESDPRSRLARAKAQGQVAVAERLLGNDAKVVPLLESATQEFAELARLGYQDPWNYAEALRHLSKARRLQGDLDGAEDASLQALEIPDIPLARHADVLYELSYVAYERNHKRDSENLVVTGIELLEDEDLDPNALMSLWWGYGKLAQIRTELGQPETAEALSEEMDAVLERRPLTEDPQLRSYVTGSFYQLGDFLALAGKTGLARKQLTRSIEIAESLVEEFPTDTHFLHQAFAAHHNTAALLGNLGLEEDARRHFERAEQLMEKSSELSSESDYPFGLLGQCRTNLGLSHQRDSHWQLTLDYASAALESFERAVAASPSDPRWKHSRCRARTLAASSSIVLGSHPEALRFLGRIERTYDRETTSGAFDQLAHGMEKARMDDRLAPEDQALLREEYLALAMQLLVNNDEAGVPTMRWIDPADTALGGLFEAPAFVELTQLLEN